MSDVTATGVSADQSQAEQITTPSQYPTAARIEDGFAYDKSGAKLGPVDEGSLSHQPASPQAAPAQTQNSGDPAETILRSAQGLDNNARRDAWQAFSDAHDEDELTEKLQSMNLPQNVKAALWNAKYQASQKNLTAARAQQPPVDKAGYSQRLRESVQLPGSASDLQDWADQEAKKTIKDRALEGLRQSTYGPLADTVEGLWNYGKRVNQNSTNAGQEVGEAIQNVKEGGPVGANIGKVWSGITNSLVSDVPFIGEPTVKAGEDIASGPESGMEPGTFHFKGGNYAGAAGSLTGVVAQLVAGDLIHEGEAKLVRTADARALEVAGKTHTTARAVYDTRVTDNVIAENQARNAAIKAAQASQDHAAGEISEAAKDEAHTNANAAAANAKKAAQALQESYEARNQAALEESKAVRRIQENVKTKPDKSAVEAQARAEEQHHTDLEDAVPSAARGPAKLSDADRQVRSKYLRNYRDTVGPVNSRADVVKAFTDIQQNMEGRVKPIIEKYSGDLLPNDPRMAVHDALADSPRKDFAAKGMAALQRYGDVSHLTLGDADELRQQLNSDNRAITDNKTSTHDVATLLDTNPEFAARYHLADSLRNGTYDYLEDRGVQGVRELRQDEASIIRNRNAAEKALSRSDEGQVRGSSKSSWKRKAAAWSAHKATVTAGAKFLGPPGAVLGDIAGDRLGEMIHPDDLTRDALVQRAMSVKGQGPAITPSIYGVGAEPNRLPGLLIPELQKAMRENTPLHGDLATHYGQSVYNTSYGDLEDRFMKDIQDKETFGVKLESDEKGLLAKINAQGAAEALKAHQAAQEAAVKGKPPVPTATLPDEIEPTMEIRGKMPNGMNTQEGLIHDLAHIVVGNEKNIPFQDGIRSHLHSENAGAGRLLSAPIDLNEFYDADGNLDVNKMKPRMADFAATYVAGGVANDLWHGIPYTENHGLGADTKVLQQFMKKAGFTDAESAKMIAQAADDAAQVLRRPGVKDILEQHAAVREAGLPETHHFSEERIQQVLQDVKGDTNGKTSEKPSGVTGEGEREAGQNGPGGKGKVQAGGPENVREERKGTPERKAGGTKEEPAKPKPKPDVNPALSEEERKIGTMEPFGFGYMRPDGSIEQGSRFGNPDVMVHDDLARTKGDKMSEVLSEPGGVKYGTGKNRGFISIENRDPKTITNALKIAESLPTEEVDFEFANPGKKPVHFEGPAKRVAGQVRRYFAEPEEYDLGEFDANPALSSPAIPERTTGVKEHDEAIRSMGAVPGGFIKGNPDVGFESHALFHDPTSESSLALPFSQVNRENVARELNKNRLEYAKASGKYTANTFNAETNRNPINARNVEHSPVVAKRIADAFDAAKHEPDNPAVKKSYDAVKRDVDDQWDYATKKMGIKFEPWDKEGQPYQGSKDMKEDVDQNKHLYFFRGGEMPENHALAATDPKTGYTYNDKLRAVHDLFGHAEHGFQFGPKGEENAWNVHRQMFSPDAIPAITTETRGQNSWVNFGQHLRNDEGRIPAKGEPGYVAPPDRPFAQQKAALLPEEFHQPNPTPTEETPFANPTTKPGGKPNFNPALESPFATPGNVGGKIPTNADTELAAVTPELEAREMRRRERQAGLNRAFMEATKGEDFNPALSAPKAPVKDSFNLGDQVDGEDVVQHLMKTAKIDHNDAMGRTKTFGAGNYRVMDVPIGDGKWMVQAGDDYNPAQAAKYAKMKSPLPAIVIEPDGSIADGNHRVAAAKLRGDAMVKALVPEGYGLEDRFNKAARDAAPEPVAIHGDDLPHRAKYQDVDFESKDLQDSGKRVTPESIRKDYAGGDKNVSIYKGYIPMEDLPHPEFPDEEERDFDRSEYRPPRDGGSPIKVEVGKDGKLSILDGNHRATVWEEQDQQYAPAWVVDRRGPNIENLSEDERAEREEEEQPEDENPNPALSASDDDLKAVRENGGWIMPDGSAREVRSEDAELSHAAIAKEEGYKSRDDLIKNGGIRVSAHKDRTLLQVNKLDFDTRSKMRDFIDTLPDKDAVHVDWQFPKYGDQYFDSKNEALEWIDNGARPNVNPALSSPKGSTVPLMKNPLEIKGTGEGDETTTLDIAKALNKYSRKQNPALQPGADEAKMTTRAKKLAEDEAKYQLAQGKTGTEWYTTEMKDHDKILQGMRPDLAGGEMTDKLPDHPVKLSLFKAAEAILSSGQKPYANFKSAVNAWDAYKETGEFPRLNPETGKSWGPRAVNAYAGAFDSLNKLIQEKGEKGAADWLLSEHPVKELRGYQNSTQTPVKGKAANLEPGAMILGAKRGPFMQNLHGIESAFTADMWVSRTWNRWMGTLDTDPDIREDTGKINSESDSPRNNAERSLMKESFEHAANKLGLSTSSLQAVLWYYEQALYRNHGIPVESWSFKDAAERVAKERAAQPVTGTISAFDFLRAMKDDKATRPANAAGLAALGGK